MDRPISTAAVFATMNRAATAVACVEALARQTSPPSLVVVADNVSTDDTVVRLEELSALPFELIVHRMSENRGNAGGVQEAIDLAFSRGVDAVWILDDDSWPRADALEALMKPAWNPAIVRHSVQIDPKTGCFTWPLQVDDGRGGWRLARGPDEMPSGDLVKSRITWTGAWLPREVRDQVGPVNGALFIRGEDEDYPWRFEQAGFAQEAVTGSVLDHPGPENMVRWELMGKKLFFERGLADWKLYYKVRNMVWLKRRQSGGLKAIAMAAAYTVAASWIDGVSRLPLILKAAAAGWNGRLGRWDSHP